MGGPYPPALQTQLEGRHPGKPPGEAIAPPGRQLGTGRDTRPMAWRDWGGSQGSWQVWQPERQVQEEPPGTLAPAQAARGNVAPDAQLFAELQAAEVENNRGQVALARAMLRAAHAAASRVWRRRHAEDYVRHCKLRLAEANNRLAEVWQRRKQPGARHCPASGGAGGRGVGSGDEASRGCHHDVIPLQAHKDGGATGGRAGAGGVEVVEQAPAEVEPEHQADRRAD